MSTSKRWQRWVVLGTLWLMAACGKAGSPGTDLGPIFSDGKADQLDLKLTIDGLGPRGTREYTFSASSSFRVELQSPQGRVYARLKLIWDGGEQETSTADQPELQRLVESPAVVNYKLIVENRSSKDAYNFDNVVVIIRSLGSQTEEDQPTFQVRFTEPQCPEVPGKAPAGMHCYATNSETAASRTKAGIVDHVNQWLKEATDKKLANPETPMKITLAYLTWNDYRWYDSMCAAAKAGIKIEGFFDEQSGGSQPPKLDNDPNCMEARDGQLIDNVTMSYLGGKTNASNDWRLMHIKMLLIDTGEKTHKLVFGSANVSSYAGSIHFENWVFSEFPTASHFIQAHYCAVEGLRADAAAQSGSSSYPNLFSKTYAECVAKIEYPVDTRYQVFFTPDPQRTALNTVVNEMRNAEFSVEMAIQHFTNTTLARQLADNGRDPKVATRLVVDDDTYYGSGEVGSGDQSVYNYTLKNAGIEIRFAQTNGFLQFGKQYQHNKYIIIDEKSVFCGAGNFTEASFGDGFSPGSYWMANYENFYLIRDANFAKQYLDHFNKLHTLAPSAENLPADPNF